jgi:hypothetical protein
LNVIVDQTYNALYCEKEQIKQPHKVNKHSVHYHPMSRRLRSTQRKNEPYDDNKSKGAWQDPQAEIVMFESMETFRPIGYHTNFAVINIFAGMKKNDHTVSPSEILRHLKDYFNLKGLDEDATPLWDARKDVEFSLPQSFFDNADNGDSSEASNDADQKSFEPASKRRRTSRGQSNGTSEK